MNPRLLLTKVGRRWFRRFPTRRSQVFVDNHFRKWCVREELPTWTREGFAMLVSPHDYVSCGIFFFGDYDPEMTHLLKAHVPEAGVCWDVGTERGWFSLLMGRLVGPEGRVDAFEAFPPNYRKLKANVALNKFTWVHTYNMAVSDHAGRMHFIPPSDEVTHHVSNSGVGYLTTRPGRGAIEVPTITVDEHSDDTGIDRLDFIKMDIEGGEVAALLGAERTIRRFRPTLAVEYNRETARRAGSSIEELDDLLDAYRYERFTFFGRLEKLRLENWKDCPDNEAVFNVYCFPRP
ncbi:MAG: FkbM family methyltransferase [Candidatus Binatia bacterium]